MIIYSASEIGSCTKYLVAKRLGFESTPGFGEDIPAFKLGHEIEARVLDYLTQHDWHIQDRQREYLLPIGKNSSGDDVAIQCHPDAIGAQTGDPTPYAIEVKSAAEDSYRAWVDRKWECSDLFLRYLYQISCYHHASSMPILFVVRSKPKVSSDVEKTHLSMYASCPPLLTLQQIKDRVLDIETRADKYNIPDECDYPNWFCPLSYLHESSKEFEDRPDIEELAREYALVVEEDKKAKLSTLSITTKRMRLRRKLLEALERDPDAESGGESRIIDTGRVKVMATWGPVSRPFPDWDKIMDVLPGVDKKDLQKQAKYGYRLRVNVRD
jgi:hypothetical protein